MIPMRQHQEKTARMNPIFNSEGYELFNWIRCNLENTFQCQTTYIFDSEGEKREKNATILGS